MRSLSEEAFEAQTITRSNLRDLCTLINLAVLYDEVLTIGNEDELDKSKKPHIAPEYQRVRDLTGLKVTIGPTQAEFNKTLQESVGFAARPFAQGDSNISLQDLKDKLTASLRLETSDRPDYWNDFEEGRQLLESRNLKHQSTLAEKFWLRSFLYAGFAAARRLPLVPDSIRTWGMDRAITCGHNYAQKLEEAINEKYPAGKIRDLITDAPLQIPPFAATVFLRSKSERRKIAYELQKLRAQLAPVRTSLAVLQHERDTGSYGGFLRIFGSPSSDSTVAADETVQDALESLRKANIPLPREALAIKSAFDMIRTTASLFMKLVMPSPKSLNASKDIYDMASSIGELASNLLKLESWEDKSAFLEVHYRVGWDLKGWFERGIEIEKLFGAIRDDEPSKQSVSR